MARKNIMKEFIIDEISVVDKPAQGGARMLLMKRADPITDEDLDDGGDYAYTPDPKDVTKNRLRLTKSVGGKPDKSLVDVAITELDALFCGDTISSEDRVGIVSKLKKAWLDANPDKTENELPTVLKNFNNKGDNNMTLEELKKQHDAEMAKKDAELKKAKTLAELNDAEKAHYGKLDDKAKDEFLSKTAEQRKAIVDDIAKGDPVVYKSADGVEYRKSDGEKVIALAKKADDAEKIAKAEKEARETNDLKKRANESFKNLPGTEDEKAALLKSIEAISDEKVREAVLKSVKAGDTAISAAFVRKGASNSGADDAQTEASVKLDTLAKKYATDNKISFAKAYDAVIQTEEGRKLYDEVTTK